VARPDIIIHLISQATKISHVFVKIGENSIDFSEGVCYNKSVPDKGALPENKETLALGYNALHKYIRKESAYEIYEETNSHFRGCVSN
jgi:hypothetical protein